jgi:hypothetical protein
MGVEWKLWLCAWCVRLKHPLNSECISHLPAGSARSAAVPAPAVPVAVVSCWVVGRRAVGLVDSAIRATNGVPKVHYKGQERVTTV